jgi:hypothetical protein
MAIIRSVLYEKTNFKLFYFAVNRAKNNLPLETQGAISPFHTVSQPPALVRLDTQYGENSVDDKSMLLQTIKLSFVLVLAKLVALMPDRMSPSG